MAFDRAALEALAESVGDGTPIDWATVEAQANPEERPIVRQLRVLHNLAHLHRTLPPVEAFAPRRLDRTSGSPAIGNWGHLALLERLGGGTFGDVYRAWDAQLEREVALKLLKGDAPDSSRLVGEGRLLARVRHEHVVSVHGVATHDDRIGLWMELVPGVTLEQLLASNGPFDAADAARAGVDLCRALAAIHGAGLVHRDVKAQNVVREEGGRIVLMDLGTGRDVARGDSAVGVAGTPMYLAPEIFEGGAASAQSDIYSLGVLLYHLVTGEYPVREASFELLEQAHATGRSVPLRERRPDLPVAFTRAVDRAIAHDPQARYSNAGEFAAALARAIEPPAHFGSRRSRLVLAAFVIIVFVVAGVSVFRPGARLAPRNASAGVTAPATTIAVLPFRNDSGDPAQDYFSDGMTDEIIATLGQIGSVNVISRTSSAHFRDMRHDGVAKTLPEIAQALNAGTIVEGSIAVTGGGAAGPQKVRIHARLIAAGTDTQIWNRTFETVGSDVNALKGQVAQAIAEGIRLRLSPTQQGTIAGAQRHQPDFEAFSLYLQGRAAWTTRTKPNIERAIELFQQAASRDPKYAAPHAGLSDAYHLLGVYGWMPLTEAMTKAADEATLALSLEDSSEAHASMGYVQDSRFEWDAAEASFRRAIELNPGNVTAHHWYGLVQSKRGAFPAAIAEVERARSLDPLSPTYGTQLAAFQLQQGNNDDAVVRLERIAQDQPNYARGHYILAQAYARMGRYDRALAETDRVAALGGNSAELRGLVACIHAAAGRSADARAILADLLTRYQNNNGDGGAANIATLYTALGETDRAFEWLERARADRDPLLGYLRVDPWFTPLRSDPRYQRLLATLGLTR